MKAFIYSIIFMAAMHEVCLAQPITNNTIAADQYILPCPQPPNLLNGTLPSGGIGSYSYVWLASTVNAATGFVAASGTNNTQNYQPSSSSTTWYKRVVNSGTFTDTSNVVSITLVNSVSITPTGPITLAPNDSVTLCVTPTITNVPYAWMKTYDFTTWTNLASATNSCYTVHYPGLGGYFCLVGGQGVCIDFWTNVTWVNFYTSINAPIISPVSTTYVCSGNTTTLSTPVIAGSTYQWLYNYAPIAGATNTTYTTSTLGNYNVEVANGASLVLSDTVTVTSFTSIPPLTVSPNTVTIYPCSAAPTFSATSLLGLTYQWYLNGNPIAGATDSIYNPIAAGNYQVIRTNGTCTDTSNMATVTVQAFNPNVTITGPTTICSGSTSTTTLCVNPTFPNAIYQWEESPCGQNTWTPMLSATNPCFSPTFSGSSYEYHCRVIFNQCPSNSYFTNSTCISSLFASISTSTGNTSYCQGDTIHLIAYASSGSTIQWYNNSSPIAGATNTSYTTIVPGNYSYIATLNGGTCTTNSGSISITVNPLPIPTIFSLQPTICQGSSALLYTNLGGMTYQWKINNAIIPGATWVSYTTSLAGTYQLIVTNINNCTDSSNNIVINVANLPVPTVNYLGNMVLTTGSFATYQWYLNGNPIAGATQQQYTALMNGNYTVEVTDANGCTGSSAVYILVGIKELNHGHLFNVFPNPFKESFTVSCPDEKGIIIITDVIGKIIQTITNHKSEFTIDMKGMSNGIYFIKYQTEQQAETIKILKQ